MPEFTPKPWTDLPDELQPNSGETRSAWLARIAAYETTHPGEVTVLDAAALIDLETRLAAYSASAAGTGAYVSGVKGIGTDWRAIRARLEDGGKTIRFQWDFGDSTAAGSASFPSLDVEPDLFSDGTTGSFYVVIEGQLVEGAFYSDGDPKVEIYDFGVLASDGKTLEVTFAVRPS